MQSREQLLSIINFAEDEKPKAYGVCSYTRKSSTVTKGKIYPIYLYDGHPKRWVIHNGFFLIYSDKERFEFIGADRFQVFKTLQEAKEHALNYNQLAEQVVTPDMEARVQKVENEATRTKEALILIEKILRDLITKI